MCVYASYIYVRILRCVEVYISILIRWRRKTRGIRGCVIGMIGGDGVEMRAEVFTLIFFFFSKVGWEKKIYGFD